MLKTRTMPLVTDPSPSSPLTRRANYCVYPGLSYFATVLCIKQLMGSSVCEVHLAQTGSIRNKFRVGPQELVDSLKKCGKSGLVVVVECSAEVDIHGNRPAVVYSSLRDTTSASDKGTKVIETSSILKSLCAGRMSELWIWDAELGNATEIPYTVDGPRIVVDMGEQCTAPSRLGWSTMTSYAPFLFQDPDLRGGLSIHTGITDSPVRPTDGDQVVSMLHTIRCEILSSSSAESRCFGCQMCWEVLKSLCTAKNRKAGPGDTLLSLEAELGDEFT